MAYVLVTRLICLMFLFILSLYILLVKGYLIFMSILWSRKVRRLYEFNPYGKMHIAQTETHMRD